jgi:branched-subunit amino acid transport protein
MNEWLLIGMMALVTYLPRYIPFALAGKVAMPSTLERALDFVPVAVLTSIIAQTALVTDGSVNFSLTNVHALAALAAFVTALLTRHLFATIVVGLLCFAGLRLLL